MSAAEDEKAYHLWIGRKVSTLRRARLDCGHPKTDAVYFHIGCDRLSCSEDCAGADHDCAAYGGAKDKSGIEKGPETVQAAAPVPMVQCDTTPWVSFADVAAGPSAGGDPATVDLRRRVQDGTAPMPGGPDRVADAFRAEVLRQGLTDCEIDGVRWIYGAGHWSKSPYQPETVLPLIDAVVEPDRSGPVPSGWYPTVEEANAVARRTDAVGLVFDHRHGYRPAYHMDDPGLQPRLPWWKRWHR